MQAVVPPALLLWQDSFKQIEMKSILYGFAQTLIKSSAAMCRALPVALTPEERSLPHAMISGSQLQRSGFGVRGHYFKEWVRSTGLTVGLSSLQCAFAITRCFSSPKASLSPGNATIPEL